MPLIDLVGGNDTKTGVMYTDAYKFQATKSVEVIKLKNGWSFDIGASPKEVFGGVSKDIISDVLDIGTGLATDFKQIEPYIGITWRF